LSEAVPKGAPTRFHSFDAIRVLAAMGIVWFHADMETPRRAFGYAGLPVFLVITFFLLAEPLQKQPLSMYLKRRAERVLVPLSFWYAFYALVLVYLRRHELGLAQLRAISVWDVLGGPIYHLWYLTFAFLAAAAVGCARWAVTKVAGQRTLSPMSLFSVFACCAVLLLGIGPDIAHRITLFPLSQWWYATPAVFIGLAVGQLQNMGATERATFSAVLVVCLLLTCFRIAPADQMMAISYALGATLAIGATLVPMTRRPVVEKLSDLTLGIYLIHPFMFTVALKLGLTSLASRFVLGVGGSGLATAAMRRSRLRFSV
jgi:peptidoglycan/LPS O-acetylase OafA/YrhL